MNVCDSTFVSLCVCAFHFYDDLFAYIFVVVVVAVVVAVVAVVAVAVVAVVAVVAAVVVYVGRMRHPTHHSKYMFVAKRY